MRLKFLGTGTSQGVPFIGCTHPVCLSDDPRDKRLRTSALITTNAGKKILIDCGPDFRQQMLDNNEDNVDAVLITHEHNDHVIGLDDLRPIIFRHGKNMDLYCLPRVGQEIRNRFPYAFVDKKYPGAPGFDMHFPDGAFPLFDAEVEPLAIQHMKIPILGYRLRKLAYITDASSISDETKQRLKDLDYLIINCLRRDEPHPSHFILPQVLDLVDELQPVQTYLIHMSHRIGFHAELSSELPAHIRPAYDGLEIIF